MRPLISIILPCYNAESFLSFAIESILAQDYTNLDIICINDGSSDRTLAMLKDYQTADTRIRILNNERNLGLITSLNNALQFVEGEFFARMDADDYSAADKISKQVKFLIDNPEYDLVSSGYHYFVEDHKKLEYVPPLATRANALKFISLFSTPLTHGSVLGRTKLIKSKIYYYDKNFSHAEDYELFSRLAWQGILLANLDEPLHWLRQNPNSVSVVFNSIQVKTHLKITQRNILMHLKKEVPENETLLRILCNRIDSAVNLPQINQAIVFVEDCFTQTKSMISYNDSEIKEVRNYIALHSLNIIIQSNKIGFRCSESDNTKLFIRSFSLFKYSHFPILFKKLANFIKFRIWLKN